jgi:hypothetical protein
MPTTAFLDAFAAPGPAPELADRLHLFGQFVGSWDLSVTTIGHDGVATNLPGEWHFGWALAGRAVADVWICPRRNAAGGSPGEHGLSLRFYDPAIAAWRSTWMGPARGIVRAFVARPTDAGIVLEGRFDGIDTRWSFSDITSTSFRWRNEESIDDGERWRLVQTFDAQRS